MENIELNEQEQNRRDAVTKLRELGIEPYPAALFEVNTTSAEIKEKYDPEKCPFPEISIAGRMMSRRIMGAASFIELQDSEGHQGLRLHHPDRSALHPRQEPDRPLQVPESAPDSQGEGRRGLRRILRPRAPLPHEVRGLSGQSPGKGRLRQATTTPWTSPCTCVSPTSSTSRG